MTPVLEAAAVERIIRDGLPMAAFATFTITAIEPGCVRLRLPFADWMLRPGGTISGPAMMTAADTAMYAVVLAHIGEQPMAVTTDLQIRFLNRPKPLAMLAEARLLKLGRRLASIEVRIATEDAPERLVAHVTGCYALPG